MYHIELKNIIYFFLEFGAYLLVIECYIRKPQEASWCYYGINVIIFRSIPLQAVVSPILNEGKKENKGV